jgi:hypothetical protein
MSEVRRTVIPSTKGRKMDWKIELIFVPVTDVDRAKDFYTSIGSTPITTPHRMRAAVRAADTAGVGVFHRDRHELGSTLAPGPSMRSRSSSPMQMPHSPSCATRHRG